MKNILFNCYYDSDLNDNIFKLDRVWLSSNNKEIKKDDKNKGFSYFYEILKSENYNIHTQDYWKKNDKIDMQINFAYHQKIICKISDVDYFKRLIGECYKRKTNLNSWMVSNGYAVAYRKYSKKYVSNETLAKQEKKGMWQGKFEMPWDYRKSKKN